MGGTGKIVKELRKLMLHAGIKIKINTEVKELIVEKNKISKIITNDEEIKNFDLVVCNADPPMVYSNLLKKYNLKRPFKRKKIYFIQWGFLYYFLELKLNIMM